MNRTWTFLLLAVATAWGIWPALSLRAAWQGKFVSLLVFVGVSLLVAVALVILAQWDASKSAASPLAGFGTAVLRVAAATFAGLALWVGLAGLGGGKMGNATNSPWTGYQIAGGFVAASFVLAAWLASRSFNHRVGPGSRSEDWSQLIPTIELSLAVSIGILAILIAIGALAGRFLFAQ